MNENKILRVGLAGNPNAGKTTIFNALTGSRQRVANYAGVTVEKKEGTLNYKNTDIVIYDLPGTYSLTAYSIDEVVARDFILNEKPDVIIDVIDSTNIERNLYLCLQFQELGIPVVAALNISDQAENMGILIDEKKLSKLLGIPMIKTVGPKEKGLTEVLDAALETALKDHRTDHQIFYGMELEAEVSKISHIFKTDQKFSDLYPARWMAIKLLEKDSHALEKLAGHCAEEALEKQIQESIRVIEAHFARDAEIVVSEQRYAYVHGASMEAVRRTAKVGSKTTELIDKVLLNRALGLPLFLLILWGIFQITFNVGEYPMEWMETFFGWLSGWVSGILPDGIIKSLVVDGIIGGVGGVFSFVPLVVILFLLISFLEDVGYMSRAAFIMDKFLHLFGLHGQSFLPMMLGFGCSIPAMMAARTLKSPKDRIITILVTPFMSCGAKLPVHVLLAGAFFPEHAGTVVLSVYLAGVILALASSVLFRKTVLKGEVTPFVMELPPYRFPTTRGILWHVWDKTIHYFKKAGTVILAASILIWLITNFPKTQHDESKYRKLGETYQKESIDRPAVQQEITDLVSGKINLEAIEDEEEKEKLISLKEKISSGKITLDEVVNQKIEKNTEAYLDTLKSQESLENSFAGTIGKGMEPILRPLGFDWKIGVAAVTGFAAKEVVVSTLGILYKVGMEEGEESESLRDALKNDPHFSPLIAYVLMLFILIIAPCFAALSVIRSEIGWKWLGFNIAYTFILAWTVSFVVYQIGSRIIA